MPTMGASEKIASDKAVAQGNDAFQAGVVGGLWNHRPAGRLPIRGAGVRALPWDVSVWGDAVLNGSLRNFPQRCGSAKHCWRSASLPPPSRRGSIDIHLGRPSRPPSFLFQILFARISLTNGESISTLFRVGKRLHLLRRGVLYSWLTPTADR